mmetsp:Transcript_8865/g.21259  ORF Transcript_8865/g.21259 Transcript_8865/m.21259 type:complete len:484 (+) Transcript_8865:415-1866(+)
MLSSRSRGRCRGSGGGGAAASASMCARAGSGGGGRCASAALLGKGWFPSRSAAASASEIRRGSPAPSSSSPESLSLEGSALYPGRKPKVHLLLEALSTDCSASATRMSCANTGRSRSSAAPAGREEAAGAPEAAAEGGGVKSGAAEPASSCEKRAPLASRLLYVCWNSGGPPPWKASAHDWMSESARSATCPLPVASRTRSAWKSLIATLSWKGALLFFMHVSSSVSARSATLGFLSAMRRRSARHASATACSPPRSITSTISRFSAQSGAMRSASVARSTSPSSSVGGQAGAKLKLAANFSTSRRPLSASLSIAAREFRPNEGERKCDGGPRARKSLQGGESATAASSGGAAERDGSRGGLVSTPAIVLVERLAELRAPAVSVQRGHDGGGRPPLARDRPGACRGGHPPVDRVGRDRPEPVPIREQGARRAVARARDGPAGRRADQRADGAGRRRARAPRGQQPPAAGHDLHPAPARVLCRL